MNNINSNYKNPINKLTNNFDKLNPRAELETDLIKDRTFKVVDDFEAIITITLNEEYDKKKYYNNNNTFLGITFKESANFLIIPNLKKNMKEYKYIIKKWNNKKSSRVTKVNDELVNNIDDFVNAIQGQTNIKIFIDNYNKRYEFKNIVFRTNKTYPVTFLELLKCKILYNDNKNNEYSNDEKENFIKILTRCQYKVCMNDNNKIISTTLKHGNYKKILNGFTALMPFHDEESYQNYEKTIKDDKLFTIHSHIFVYDPKYLNTFTFDLVTNGKMCQISIPALRNKCMNKESNWFNLEEKDLNLNIDNDITYKTCNLKGELFRFLWKYITNLEFNYNYNNYKNTVITQELKDYRKKIYREKQDYLKKKISYRKITNRKKYNSELDTQLQGIENKIEMLNNVKIIDESLISSILNDIKKYSNNIKFTIYLPYPEIKYNMFGMGLSSNYKKKINCQKFTQKMFGISIIKSLYFKNFDTNILNYNRLQGLTYKKTDVNQTYLKENRFQRPNKEIYEDEAKMKKEKNLRKLYQNYITGNKNINLINLLNNSQITNTNKEILKKSVRLHKSKKKFEDFYNIMINSMINSSKKELNSLFISPKLKKELSNKFQKKIKKKSKIKTIINSIKSIGKSKKKNKNMNNRQTRIRKRLMIAKLKQKYPNEPNIRTINSNNITIKKLSNIYKKHFKNRYEMIKKLKNKDKNNLIKYINYDNFTHNNLNNMSYDKLNNLYKKIYTTNSPFNTNESVISKTKKKLKNIKSSYFTK